MKISDNLFSQVQSVQCQKYGITSCIKDGILYPGEYERSPFRMVIILKEPYAGWDAENQKPISEDFDFSDIVHNLKGECQSGLNRTWLKVASIAYSLKNNTPYTEDLSYAQVVDGLKCVCWINLSKTPWATTSDIRNPEYLERVKAWDPVVKAQLDEASKIGFDIVWYGNTFDVGEVPLNPVHPHVDWDDFHDINNLKEYVREVDSGENSIFISKYKKTDILLVNGYHPSYGNSAEWTVDCIKDYRAYF